MFPEIDPYRTGLMDVGGGHHMYWEECGNPAGKPVLIVHGGPGSGCSANNRRYFDPSVSRIILFDQRNCGRSRPLASEPDVDLTHNTTAHLISDMEKLREFLGIESWLVKGASWGSVLSLAYAQQHPSRVSGLILISMGTGRVLEVEILTNLLGRIFPESWARLVQFAENDPTPGSVLKKMARLLFSQDCEIRKQAAIEWCLWECAMQPTNTGPSPRFASEQFRLLFARLVTHYWSNDHFLEDGQILRNAPLLTGIPGAILQGRLDLSNLAGSPWELASKWPGSELIFIEDSGHEGSKTFRQVLLEVIARFS